MLAQCNHQCKQAEHTHSQPAGLSVFGNTTPRASTRVL
jgi:hypothetical protein